MTIDRIHKLSVEDFRCLPDQEVGPFGDFNLVFGANGSGKTSLFEAIELALTGASARIRTRQEIQAIVSRSASASACVTVYGSNDIPLGTFFNGKLKGGPQAQIRDLFGLDVTGKKASRLLPQLFSIHNVLYADTIVSFLRADQKKALNDALVELAAGVGTMRTWRKLEAAQKQAASVCQDATSQLDRREEEVQRLQGVSNGLAIDDTKHLSIYGKQLAERLPAGMWDEGVVPPFEPLTSFLGQVARIEPRLSEVLNVIDDLASHEAVAGGATWESINEEKGRAEAGVAEAQRIRGEAAAQLDTGRTTRRELRKARDVELRHLAKLGARKERLAALSRGLETLREWSPEAQAQQEEKELKRERAMQDEVLQAWTRIEAEAKALPSVEETSANWKELARLKNDEAVLKRSSAEKVRAEQEARVKLDEVEKTMRASEETWSSIQDAVHELHAKASIVSEAHPNRECPVCGHDWQSEERLADAVAQHFETLSRLLGQPSESLSTLLSSRDALRSAATQAATERDAIAARQKEVGEEMNIIESELSGAATRANRIIGAIGRSDPSLEAPPIDLDSIGERYPGFRSEELREQVQNARNAVDAVDSQTNALWTGLRREEFLELSTEIEAHRASLESGLRAAELDAPGELTRSALRQLQEDVATLLAKAAVDQREAEANRVRLERKLAELEARLLELQADLEAADLRVEESVVKSSRAAHLVSQAERLAVKGMVQRGGGLRLEEARRVIADAVADVAYLMKEGPRYAKQLQEASQIRSELGRAQAAKEIASRELTAATQLKQRLSTLAAPGDAEAHTLEAMAGTISNVFGRLHWPFDFKSVAFDEGNGTPEVLVEPRFGAGDLVPAHERLSAGQRAALAISVFWTLNSSRATAPRVMLMDEPVQNIDELNALNFLDSLRWLVERGGRQVFISTSSRRLAGLIRRKFAYLGPRFVEVSLERAGEVAEVVTRRDTARGRRGAFAGAS